MVRIDIDPDSGFCGGVIRAISRAEEKLSDGQRLYSLGAIVHNDAELARLEGKGLITIGLEDLDAFSDAGGERLLIRAHGEPPSTYRKAVEKNFEIIDCTCPVVLKLQKSIRETHKARPDGQIVIFGRVGHAEVLGLAGQTEGKAIVVEHLEGLRQAVLDGRVDLSRRIDIFSQTTKNPVEYEEILGWLSCRASELTVHRTICSQVASRHSRLSAFASSHDVIVFVSGKASSNGKVLCELCEGVNPRTHHIDSVGELRGEWFRDGDNVGVCGATSTPKWLLEDVAGRIREMA